MSKISTIVKVRGGYANYVQLRNALREDTENAERMAMYRPTKGHRMAMGRISRGLFTPNDKKFYLLSGSYGTGKSHLCLMLANLLGKSSDDPSLKLFYDNYAKLDAASATNLKNIRQGGQYLVAVCDYGSGQRFEDAVLKAIVEACAERGISTDKQTEFDEAERLLSDWENAKGGVRSFYGDFTKALAAVSPGTPIAALRAGLRDYNRAMMDKFHTAYAEAQGVPFQSKAGNLVAIVKKLVASPEFTEKFKGLAIFFDEFGTAILQSSKYDAAVMQAFMEEVCQQLSNVVFVGCIHKRFQDYAERTNQATASVMSARLTPVDLLNEGIEEIIGAIVETEKSSPEWKEEVLPKAGIFDQLTPQCLAFKLFPWITDSARIRERVLEDIYGMHPMALYCLLRLSSEIGSDARSTFTFFSGGAVTERGSYTEFIEKNDITQANGALRLYQTPQLFEFFEKELSPGNRELLDSQRALVNGYVASLQALRKSVSAELFDEQQDERVALLRMVLLFSLCSQPTTLEALQFGRYCTNAAEKATVKRLLGELATAGAVYLRKPSNTYELCATEGQDPLTLVESFANLAETEEKATVEELLKQTGHSEEFLNANGWNIGFGEDKRLKRTFVRGRELGHDMWAKLEQEAAAAGAKFSTAFEGHAVYALCEDEAEAKLAREAIKTIPAGTILVAIPHEPTPFRDELRMVLACRHFLAPEEAGKHPAQTIARIQDMWDGGDDSYLPILKRIVTGIENGSQATWYEQGGKLLVEKPPQAHQPADMLCGRLFVERCQVKHRDLNVVHDDKWQKSPSLKQAVSELLDISSAVQIDNGNPENHGEKLYLQKVLLPCGALRPLPGSTGPVKSFAAESDAAKLDAKFPVLKKLCEGLNALKPNETLGLAGFSKTMRAAPVGGSGTMLVLALAHAVRAFGERLRIFRDSTRTDTASLTSYEAIVAAISDRSSKIEIAVREITEPQRQWVEAIAKSVDAPPLAAGETRSVTSACAAVRAWWNKLPAVAKVLAIHPAETRPRLDALRQALGDGQTDSFDLLLSRLPAVYAGETVQTINQGDAKNWSEAFAADVKRLNGGLSLAKRQLAEDILAVHGSSGDMVVCEKVVTSWFAGLSPDQRDVSRCEDDDAQQLLNVLNDSTKPFEGKLMQTLAKQWGFGAVTDWTSLHIDAYRAKWELAKKAIEEIRPLVAPPTAKPDELATVVKPYVWEVEDGAKIHITIPPGATSVYYTLGDENAASAAERITIKEDAAVALDLKGKPVGGLQITAVDSAGNASRPVNYRFLHKQKQHEVTVEQEDLLGEKGSFKFPGSLAAFVAVVRSLTKAAQERKIITPQAAEHVEAALKSLQ